MIVITGVKPSNVRYLYSLFYRSHTDLGARWMILVYEYCCYTVSGFSCPVISEVIKFFFFSCCDSESSNYIIDIEYY